MRIAFFGGTFDPPHRGHIAIARAAITRLALDQVLVAPVATQPLKAAAHSSFEDRLAMVRLAVAGEPGSPRAAWTRLCPAASRTTPSTPCSVAAPLQPSDELFCLLGADSFLTLKRWHQCAELLLFCDFIVAGRPGFSLEQITAALPAGVENTGEHREAAFTRFALAGPSGQARTVSVARSGPGYLGHRDSCRSGRRARSSKPCSPRSCGVYPLPRALPARSLGFLSDF